MALIEKIVEFDATAEEVFSIVEHVEGFSNYSVFVEDIIKHPDGTYEWKADFFGFKTTWKARITRSERPNYFEWETISGLHNKGSYHIEDIKSDDIEGGRARVTFDMEYDLKGGLLETLAAPMINKAMDIVSKEVMENIAEEIRLRRS